MSRPINYFRCFWCDAKVYEVGTMTRATNGMFYCSACSTTKGTK